MTRGLSGRGPARPVWPFFFGTALIMVANGLQGTLIALRAALEGFSLAATGMVMSGYFLGLLAGSLLSARLVRRVGHVPVFAAFASIASASILMQSLLVDVAFWTAMRIVTGYCYGTMYVVVESWLNQRATNESRGRLLSLHMITVFAGAAAGQLLLNASDPRAYDLFLLVSILVSFAMVPLLLAARPGARPHSARRMPVSALYRASPVGFVSTVLTGVSHGAMFGMGPVYAQTLGLNTAQVAWFMALGMIGAIFSQWPLGALSDRFDRRRVMLGLTLVGAAAAATMAGPSPDSSYLRTFAAVFVLGAAALPLYSLCIAHVNDYVSPREMVGASAALVFVSGLGLIAGPMVASVAIEALGPPGFGQCLAVLHFAMAAFIVFRMGRRAAKPIDEQAAYVPAAARGSPVVVALAAEEGREIASAGEAEMEAGGEASVDPAAGAGRGPAEELEPQAGTRG